MEIIPEGVHFRLVQDDELPAILGYLKQYLPEAIKVCATFHYFISFYFILSIANIPISNLNFHHVYFI